MFLGDAGHVPERNHGPMSPAVHFIQLAVASADLDVELRADVVATCAWRGYDLIGPTAFVKSQGTASARFGGAGRLSRLTFVSDHDGGARPDELSAQHFLQGGDTRLHVARAWQRGDDVHSFRNCIGDKPGAQE